MNIAADFPAVWSNPDVSNKDRKRIVHLVIEDVTLIKDKEITVNIRFKGGATRSIILPKPLFSWEITSTDKKIVEEIDKLVEDYTDKEIANILNKQGLRSGTNKEFTNRIVGNIRRSYQIKSRYERLREKGLLSRQELADKLGVSIAVISEWRNKGYLKTYRYCSNKRLYEEPEQGFQKKIFS